MSSDLARYGLSAPVNVTWEITLKCNLKCLHCLSDAGKAMPEELDFGQCRLLIEQLAAIKVFQVNIGGGEPFMREDFVDLLDLAHRNQLVTCVSTNGLLVDDSLAKHLARLEMLYLQVSLDGATAEVNDAIRGEGTYHKILRAADALARHGVRFSLNTVLTRINYPQLEELRKLAAGYGADLRVSRFRPSGRGKSSKVELGPDKEQLESFAVWLEENQFVRTGDSFFCLTSENRRRKGLDMCGAAKMTCCVSPSGDVYPCAFLQEPAFLAGNIRRRHIKDIWDHAPVLDLLRRLDVKACETCSRFEHCRGGCPAMAFHTYNDISMPDPECLMNLRALSSGDSPKGFPLS
ncbi:MAG: mycofactocin radical SAM maturase [Syntrophobacteraceae bacterium]|nr:mycofactocin radical SAM maturase [Syntrophobacteraceae bacterium]